MKIFHILHKKDWEKFNKSDQYIPKDFEHEGFIHCSKINQIVRVANAKYKGIKDLLLLEIDSKKVKPEIRFEKSIGTKEEHPHIYGPLNTNAVTKVCKLEPDVNGFFTLPDEHDIVK